LAIVIGMAAGLLNFIPYLGSAFALVAGLCMSLLGGWNPSQLIGVVVAYAAVQSFESFVITPRIVGKTVGLNEVWVLLALFVGGELFGFMGILLALPSAAVAKIFVTRAVRRYRESELYLRPRAEAPSEIDPSELAQRMDTEPPARGR
jgi:predicted PurR-regulated permease PerM